MMENFDALEKAIDEMGNFIDTLLAENTQLKSNINGLKNTLDDRLSSLSQILTLFLTESKILRNDIIPNG